MTARCKQDGVVIIIELHLDYSCPYGCEKKFEPADKKNVLQECLSVNQTRILI